MAVTIRDVAKEANVAPSTVSRVIAGSSKISDETKVRVQEAIKKLNYQPNAIARSLANNSTNTLGLILPNEAEDLFKNPFFIQIMTGISIYAQKKGYYIMYAFSKNEEEELKFIKNYTGSKLVDGIILLTSRSNDKCINYINKIKYPFVVVGRPENTSDVLWVDNDNFQAMYKVVSMLITKGFRDIAYIGGPKDFNMSKDRLDGYKRALQAHGISYDEKLVAQNKDFTESLGYEAMKEICKYKVPQAVVTTDDLLAFGANSAMKEMKLKDIALVGFNNTPLASYQNPPLSSVDINADKLGYNAAKLLIDKLEKKDILNNHYIVETNLIERESSKKL